MEVRCVDCGFLARGFSTGYSEMPAEMRMHPEEYGGDPVCFVRALEFKRDYTGREVDASGHVDTRGLYAVQMTQPRTCTRFRKWDLGFSPKEHVEMHMIEMQEQREDKRDRWAKIELAIVGIGVPVLMILVQFLTTRMMVSAQLDATKMQIDATAKAAVDAHHDARIRQDNQDP